VRALLLSAALLLAPALLAQEAPSEKKGPSTQELLAQLKIDLAKAERAIAITELQIGKSRAAAYLPELQFRLAELYVEKSRYLYLQHQLEAGAQASASQVAPEVRLTKQKALQIYDRILRDFPDWSGCDRVRFFMAHEHRELGDFEQMLKYEEELVAHHPKSPLAREGLLIIGDHWFSAKDLKKAEAAYQRVLAGPPAPVRDLAAFKMGWVRFNQAKHGDAVKYFEEAASSPLLDGASQEVLSVKREALFDLVFSYTEARPWQGSVDYFEKLSPSSAIYAGVLEKLANRYFIKQEWEAAVPAYRKLLAVSRDPQRGPELVGRLHDAVKAGGDKTPPRAQDVWGAVRVAARTRVDERLSATERKAALDELEVVARDLATRLLVIARKAQPASKALFAQAAEAHTAWLSLYRDSPQRAAMQRNEADALFAAERFHEAGRSYEKVAQVAKGAEVESALYDALSAHARAGQTNPQELSPWQRTDSLRAMSLLGAQYVSKYPQSQRVATVKFNVARAAYDEGAYARAAELFTAYVDEHPRAKESRAAAHLVLDSLHSLLDYEGLEKAGQRLAANERLDPALRQELRQTVARARSEQLSTVALQSSARTGDAAPGLLELAQKQQGTELGERAMHAAWAAYREKRDAARANQVAAQFLDAYPRSPLAVEVLTLQARAAMERADFDFAAATYEALHTRFPGEGVGQDAAQTAAALRGLLGDHRREVMVLEALPVERRGGAVGRKLAEARLQAGDAAGAEAAAGALVRTDRSDADAGVLYLKALLSQGKAEPASRAFRDVLKSVRRSRATDESVARLWDQEGDASLRLLLAAPTDPLEAQVALLKSVQEASAAVAQLRAGELAVKGIYRLAISFEKLAQTLAASPAPPKLSDRDQQRYLSTLQQQAAGLRQQSQEAFAGCAQKARELDVFAPFVLACQRGQRAPDEQPAQQPAVAAAMSNAIAEARGKLDKRTSDAATLEELGVAQLAAGDLHRARLSLQRAVQVEDARASAHAALGVALARLGEPALARDAYRRALELDPTLDRALAGLAALRCRYGNAEGAKVLLSRMRSKADPRAPDADPDVARCGGNR
jgi:tetratricopeptide (TPR) repeat protein